MACDIRIRNGTVIDPLTGSASGRDVCVHQGILVDPALAGDAAWDFDADGLLVMPGLIDFHVHAASQLSGEGFPVDALLPLGVTSAVDAGTSGSATWQAFVMIAAACAVRMKAYLDVWPSGSSMHQRVDPAEWDPGAVRECFARYPDFLLGLKLRFGKPFLKHHDIRSLTAMLDLAESLGVPVAVHCTDAPVRLEEICDLLGPGDVLVHCYEGTGNTILTSEKTVSQAVRDARARGVIMDACNGRMNWTFDVAEAALEEGFAPDVISSDMTRQNMYRDPVWGLPYLMSKYLMLGMDLTDIVRCVTLTPAKLMRLESEVGGLGHGMAGDIAVFSMENRPVRFSDTRGETRTGNALLVPQLTVLGGRVMYRSMDSLDRG